LNLRADLLYREPIRRIVYSSYHARLLAYAKGCHYTIHIDYLVPLAAPNYRQYGNAPRQGKLTLWQVIARVIDQSSRLSSVRLAGSHAACDILELAAFNEGEKRPILSQKNLSEIAFIICR